MFILGMKGIIIMFMLTKLTKPYATLPTQFNGMKGIIIIIGMLMLRKACSYWVGTVA